MGIRDENFRFLTARGMPNRSTNRPILKHPNGDNITMKQCKTIYGGKHIDIVDNKLCYNIRQLEDCCQVFYPKHLSLVPH